MCLKKSCFPDCWKVSSVVLVFKNIGERSTAKNYHLVSLLSVVTEVFEKFEKLVNNRIVNQLAFDIFIAFDRVWNAGLLHKLNSYGI